MEDFATIVTKIDITQRNGAMLCLIIIWAVVLHNFLMIG